MRLYISTLDQQWMAWLDTERPERLHGHMIPGHGSTYIGTFPDWISAFVMGASALRIKNLQTR